MNFIKEAKRSWIITAVAYLALGLVLCIWPEQTGNMICYITGGVVVLIGLYFTVNCFFRMGSGVLNYDLVIGVLALAGGIYIIVHPAVIMSILPVCFGVAILVGSLIRLQRSLELLRVGYRSWWVLLVIAVITGGFGIFLLVYPFEAAKTLLLLLGIGLVANGIIDIITAFAVTDSVRREIEAREELEADFTEVER